MWYHGLCVRPQMHRPLCKRFKNENFATPRPAQYTKQCVCFIYFNPNMWHHIITCNAWNMPEIYIFSYHMIVLWMIVELHNVISHDVISYHVMPFTGLLNYSVLMARFVMLCFLSASMPEIGQSNATLWAWWRTPLQLSLATCATSISLSCSTANLEEWEPLKSYRRLELLRRLRKNPAGVAALEGPMTCMLPAAWEDWSTSRYHMISHDITWYNMTFTIIIIMISYDITLYDLTSHDVFFRPSGSITCFLTQLCACLRIACIRRIKEFSNRFFLGPFKCWKIWPWQREEEWWWTTRLMKWTRDSSPLFLLLTWRCFVKEFLTWLAWMLSNTATWWSLVLLFSKVIHLNIYHVISPDIIWYHMTGLFADLDPNVDKAVTRVFTEYTNWYMMLRIEEHNETTLERLDQAGKTLLLSLKVFTEVSGPLSKVSSICHMISCDVILCHMMLFAVHQSEVPHDPALPC